MENTSAPHQDLACPVVLFDMSYAEKMIASLGYTDAICIAMEFQLFDLAEQLRHLQDDYYA